jgi:hypothetical protein
MSDTAAYNTHFPKTAPTSILANGVPNASRKDDKLGYRRMGKVTKHLLSTYNRFKKGNRRREKVENSLLL